MKITVITRLPAERDMYINTGQGELRLIVKMDFRFKKNAYKLV